ncbi:centromere protein S-like [Diorhabda carinulata]|uniref:centromere protein S-like n=1 Tax=Diorhabda sublineata TaxID=1163346 RepID=UPI0024E1041B|nr:centromere protein S-like [Diorhabda sublineata]XP_057656461.1 centromere protein S-like [Diorhabda carinulata]
MSNEQKTRQTIYNTTKEIANKIGGKYEVEFDNNSIDLISELVYKKIISYGKDLESFQKHAKRSTITTDDVKLLVRNNKSLVELVDSKLKVLNSLKQTEDPTTTSKRKRK